MCSNDYVAIYCPARVHLQNLKKQLQKTEQGL